MTLQIGLNIVTLLMCVLTLSMATAALLPHMRQGLIIIRDGLLWLTLIVVVGGVAVVGWGRFFRAVAAREAKATAVERVTIRLPAPPASEPVSASASSSSTAFHPSATRPAGEDRGRLRPAFSANRSWPVGAAAAAASRPGP